MLPNHFKKYWDVLPGPVGLLLLITHWLGFSGTFYSALALIALLFGVLASVRHADLVAEFVGAPYGSLLLALAVTIVEVGLLVSLMLAGGPEAAELARDTVFSAVMIILNGIVGLCLFLGSFRHGEQSFGLSGVTATLATLAAIAILTLILPNFTLTTPGPTYSDSQLGFIAVVSLILYGGFLFLQTGRHKNYFLSEGAEAHHALPSRSKVSASTALLLCGLFAVVLLAKSLAPAIEGAVLALHAPQALVGVIIAAIILLPEGIAAVQAATKNRLQISLNLALGSALASIGLTIPVVALISLVTGWPLMLGLDAKSCILLVLSLFVASLSLGVGKTTFLQGLVHLVIFAVYLFTTIVP